MLSITTKSPYAVRALAELARSGAGPVPIGELAQRRVKGGYSFAREPSEVTVLEVVELLDGPFGAGAESVFSDAAAAARAILQNATINNVVERENLAAGAHMYYI